MSEKLKALGLLLLLAVAIVIGHYWALPALVFLVQTAFIILMEIALMHVRIGR